LSSTSSSGISTDRFWEEIPFDQLNQKQWELICDGCAQCCAHKLQDEDTEEIFLTNVVCQYLDRQKCQCSVYGDRHVHVPDCIKITPENAKSLRWIPDTCGYKLLANGKPLPEWHPLETSDALSTAKANMTITDKVISEADIELDDLEDYLVEDDYFTNMCRKIGARTPS
jgi:uncharacterized cysteine cluster protein YcgN (CxxCxxCC family)